MFKKKKKITHRDKDEGVKEALIGVQPRKCGFYNAKQF